MVRWCYGEVVRFESGACWSFQTCTEQGQAAMVWQYG